MDTAAYDKNLPCLNPNCKSHGKPHPNCRCYALSDGGEVSHFCSESREHKSECEYFSSGGEADTDFIPDDKVPDSSQSADPDFIPDDKAIASQASDPDFIPDDKVPDDHSLVRQIGAGLEGASQGVLGNVAKALEVKSGIATLPEIEQREQDFPVTHGVAKAAGFAGSLMAGPGKAIASSVGSKVLGNLLLGVAYQGSDNIAKAMLNQPGGDPKEAVASTLANGGLDGLMYTLTDGLFAAAKPGVKALQNSNIARAAENWMIDLADKPINKMLEGSAVALAAKYGHSLDSVRNAVESAAGAGAFKKWAEPYIEKIIGKPLTKANQYVGDVVLNSLAKNNFYGIPSLIEYAQRVSKTNSIIEPALNAMMKSGTHEVTSEPKESIDEAIRKWMDSGGVEGEIQTQNPQQQPAFAEGGQVGQQQVGNAFAKMYPTENVLLNTARGRISNYLNSVRPNKNTTKLPFDSDNPQKEKEKSYQRAIEISGHPLSVLNHINNGTLNIDTMKHFTQMYPEVHELLSNKMHEKIVEAQLKKEKPPYKKRQAMSLFLGTSLDSTLTPQSIATIQGIYAMNRPQQQQPPIKNKKGTAPLSKGPSQFLTSEQSREQRQQNSKA